jgi:hypothetical protein
VIAAGIALLAAAVGLLAYAIITLADRLSAGLTVTHVDADEDESEAWKS